MSRHNDRLIQDLLKIAEKERRCYAPSSPAIQKALLRRVGRTVVSPCPGLFAEKTTWEALDRAQRHARIARACAIKHPDWVFCSYTAACLWGLEVSWKHLGHMHVCSVTKPAARPVLYVERHEIQPVSVSVLDDVRVTPPAQTVVDCLMETGLMDGMPIADSALRVPKLSRGELLARLEVCRSGRRVRNETTAAKVLELADARAESGGESVARAKMIETGFAPDFLQYEMDDPFAEGKTMRSDFGWSAMAKELTLGELDGLVKYTDEAMLAGRTATEALVAERQRESHLSVYGHPLVRFTMRDVRTPGVLEHMLQVAGVRQGPLPLWLNDVEP